MMVLVETVCKEGGGKARQGLNTIDTTDRTRCIRKNYDVRSRKFARASLSINEGLLQIATDGDGTFTAGRAA